MSWLTIIPALLKIIGVALNLWASEKKKRDAKEEETLKRKKDALKDAFDAIDDDDESALVLALARMRK